MATKKVSEVVARPTRGTVMLAAAVGLVTAWDNHVAHLSHKQDALLGISQYSLAIGIAYALVSAVVVQAENHFGIGILRSVPPKKAALVDGKGTEPPTGAQVVAGVRARHDAPVVRIHPDDIAALAAALNPAATKRTAAKKTTPRKRTGQ